MPPITIRRSGLFENQPQMTLKVENSPGQSKVAQSAACRLQQSSLGADGSNRASQQPRNQDSSTGHGASWANRILKIKNIKKRWGDIKLLQGPMKKSSHFLLVLLRADLMAKQLRAQFTLTKFLPLFRADQLISTIHMNAIIGATKYSCSLLVSKISDQVHMTNLTLLQGSRFANCLIIVVQSKSTTRSLMFLVRKSTGRNKLRSTTLRRNKMQLHEVTGEYHKHQSE